MPTLPPANWTVAHVIEAAGIVALFVAFDRLRGRCLEPGFYLFLFALWFTLSLMRYGMYYTAYYEQVARQPVLAQLWATRATFGWVVFILAAFAAYDVVSGRRG
jgi:hypothetical protein